MAQVRIPSDRPPTPPGDMLLEEELRQLERIEPVSG
jgi:hypothetical protein